MLSTRFTGGHRSERMILLGRFRFPHLIRVKLFVARCNNPLSPSDAVRNQKKNILERIFLLQDGPNQKNITPLEPEI